MLIGQNLPCLFVFCWCVLKQTEINSSSNAELQKLMYRLDRELINFYKYYFIQIYCHMSKWLYEILFQQYSEKDRKKNAEFIFSKETRQIRRQCLRLNMFEIKKSNFMLLANTLGSKAEIFFSVPYLLRNVTHFFGNRREHVTLTLLPSVLFPCFNNPGMNYFDFRMRGKHSPKKLYHSRNYFPINGFIELLTLKSSIKLPGVMAF